MADESHNLKNKEAKRTSVALPFLKSAAISLCLTGLTRNPVKIKHMHVHVHMHIHVHVDMHIHTHTRTNKYRYRHVHIHIYIHIYTHTHTHTDTDTLQNAAIYLKNWTCVDWCSMQLCILLYPSPSPSPSPLINLISWCHLIGNTPPSSLLVARTCHCKMCTYVCCPFPSHLLAPYMSIMTHTILFSFLTRNVRHLSANVSCLLSIFNFYFLISNF